MEIKTYIGIDPDLKASGVAIWKDGKLEVFTSSFSNIMIQARHSWASAEVRVEAGWLNRSNFHIKDTDNPRIAAEKGRRVGENHATGKLIAEFLKDLSINVKLVRPTNSKVSRKSFEEASEVKVKNQEEIDSAMLLFDKWGKNSR